MKKADLKNVIIFMIGLFLLPIQTAFPMEMAITVDDLPANGELPPHTTRMDVAKEMLSVFKKHHLKNVYGFMNGQRAVDNKDGFVVLEKWVTDGQLLGNHTYSHSDLATKNTAPYIDDINRNGPLLAHFMSNKDYHYFRYPYLAEGNTQEKRDTIRQFLFKAHYQISPVTVDFFDYEWNAPYIRCLKKQDKNSIQWLKKAYIEQALNALAISHSLSMMLFNRDIKNVLLIHIHSFNAKMLDTLLTAYERQDVRFISLPDALNDKVYRINPNIVRDRTYTFLNQTRISRGLDNPEIARKLYASLPEEKLDNLCK